MVGYTKVRNGLSDIRTDDLFLLVLYPYRGSLCNTTLHTKECIETITGFTNMSNEVLAIIIAVIIMVPAILFYELIIVRNYADKFLPPTILSLFSNGNPRNLNKDKKSS